MSTNTNGINWIVYIIIFIPLLLIQRSCNGAMKPKINCQDTNTYCYSWKGTQQLAAVISKGGNNVEIRTPIGTGQGKWTGGPGDASAKVFFQTKQVNCFGVRSSSILLGYNTNVGLCTD